MEENKLYFTISGMHCSNCAKTVEDCVNKINGVSNANVSLLTNSMEVEIDSTYKKHDIEKYVKKAGYKAVETTSELKVTSPIKNKTLFTQLLPSIILLIPLFYISMASCYSWYLGVLKGHVFYIALIELFLSLIICSINYKTLFSGFKAIIRLKPNMDSLITLASFISFAYSIVFLVLMYITYFNHNITNSNDLINDYFSSLSFETPGMILTFISIGKTLEEFTKNSTKKSLESLLKLIPDKATIIIDKKEQVIDASELKVNDIFVIKPGDVIPCDGVVVWGNSSIDESTISGESIPIDKEKNSVVMQGSKNINSVIYCKATNTNKESTFYKIMKMVKEASTSKNDSTKLADQLSLYFIPIVFTLSMLTIILWATIGKDYIYSHSNMNVLSYSLKQGISVLVVSCPCALGLATPVSVMVSTGLGAKNGIFIKNSHSLELLSKVKYAFFDKTGTLTKGDLKIQEIKSSIDYDKFLNIIKSLETLSNHPIGQTISKEINSTFQFEVNSFSSEIGFGIKGEIEKTIYGIGNDKYLSENSLNNFKYKDELQKIKLTCPLILYVYKNRLNDEFNKRNLKDNSSLLDEVDPENNTKQKQNGNVDLIENNNIQLDTTYELIGYIALSDNIKENAKDVIDYLKQNNIQTFMLTGDNQLSAKKVAEEIQVDKYYYSLLPSEKHDIIAKLNKKGTTTMIGDGVNDALALLTSDVGISLSSGREVAIDASDIILKNDNLESICKAYRLAKKSKINIVENLLWALVYNLIMIPIASGLFTPLGLLSIQPWMSSLAMALSSICVVLNALRLNFVNLNKWRK